MYLLLLLIVLVALYVLSRNYMNNTENLNKDMYPLKALLPIGLMLQTKLGFRYNSDYNKKIKIKLGQISGFKNTDYFIKIFWSEKIIYLYLYLIFATTIITLTEPDVPVLIFLLIILYITWILPDSQIDTKIKKRTKSIEMDFPDFVQQTSLLTGAGLPVINALKRISDDSIKNKKTSPLYTELNQTMNEIYTGTDEITALENFAKRLRNPVITRFISILIQDIHIGNKDMQSTLRLMGNEVWEMRKNTVRKFGEEASTKLMIPIMLMFIAVLLIVIAPVLMAFKDI